jgi:hypothetical protein
MRERIKNGAVVLWGIVSIFSGLFLFFSTGCYYDNEEELYPGGQCDTTNTKFSAVIQPILEANCLSCHSNSQAPVSGNGVSFEGYSNFYNYLSTGQETFLGAIHRDPGFPQMPKNGPKLQECDIRKIEIWIENGKQNN